MKISLFIPCFVDQFYPQIGMSIVKILERLGHTVDYPEAQTCCGQPPFNSGYWDEARAVAERQMAVFRDAENVVIASGSCGAMVKVFYPELFHGHPREAEAKALAAKTFEFSDFLVNKLGVRGCRRKISRAGDISRRLPRPARIGLEKTAAPIARTRSKAWNWWK